MPSTCLGWGHGLPGARGMRIDSGAGISPNSRVQIGSIGVEISFNALDKFGIYRIGIYSRVFASNPRPGSSGILVTPPPFEIAWSGLLREVADVGLTDRLADARRRLPNYGIFPPIVIWCRVDLCACFVKVSAPKTEIAHAGRVE